MLLRIINDTMEKLDRVTAGCGTEMCDRGVGTSDSFPA